MLNRHELPPFLPTLELKDMQTSVLTEAIQQKLATVSQQFTISEVLNEWLGMDPVQVTMDQQIRVGAILQTLGCSRVRTRRGMIYLPPEDPVAFVSLRNSHRMSEPLNPKDPFPLFELGPWSAVITAAVLAAAGVGIVLGLMAIGYWIHSGLPGLPVLPLGQLWQG